MTEYVYSVESFDDLDFEVKAIITAAELEREIIGGIL